MLLARVAFDLLRSPKFKLQIIAHIQKKLDELEVPDYINALQVSHGNLACHRASRWKRKEGKFYTFQRS